MYYSHFWPLHTHLWSWGGPKYGYFGGKNRAVMAGLLGSEDPTWKPTYAPYHISLHGWTCIWAIFDLSMHIYGAGGGPKYGNFWVKIAILWPFMSHRGNVHLQMILAIWRISVLPYLSLNLWQLRLLLFSLENLQSFHFCILLAPSRFSSLLWCECCWRRTSHQYCPSWAHRGWEGSRRHSICTQYSADNTSRKCWQSQVDMNKGTAGF